MKEESDARTLWLPCIFAYVFSFYFCYVMYNEYRVFLSKRIQYLLKGDSDTHPQTYYTVMIEKIPVALRNPKVLKSFFSRLFPDDVYSIEFAVDLKEIDVLCAERAKMRYQLEKSLAVLEATSERPMVLIKSTVYSNSGDSSGDALKQPLPQTTGWLWSSLGYIKYDAIDHYYYQLTMLNKSIEQLQEVYISKINDSNQVGGEHDTNDVVGRVEVSILHAHKKVSNFFSFFSFNNKNNDENDDQEADLLRNDTISNIKPFAGLKPIAISNNPLRHQSLDPENKSDSGDNEGLQLKNNDKNGIKTIQSIAKSGFSAVTNVTKSTLHGILEASRTLELLTVGAYYNVSSTAFVTFSSRVTVCQAQKLLLSHGFAKLRVKAAPNPDDVIWTNLTIPEKQYQARRHLANIFFMFGAISWSAVITCITAISNLESLSNQKGFHWLRPLRSNQFFIFVNNYLALGLLLIILAFLPALFNLSAVNYEGYKVVSEVQNIIMTRYFYYQIANIYVSVGFGSITSGITQIINNPGNILNVLGYYIASFSVYFANLVVIKTFTGLPVEFLRLWPLIQLGFYTLFRDKNKCTRRELASGSYLLTHSLTHSLTHLPTNLLTHSLTHSLLLTHSLIHLFFRTFREAPILVRLDLSESADDLDDHVCVLLHRPVHHAIRCCILCVHLPHVQISIVIHLHDELPIRRFYVVLRFQSLHDGLGRRYAHPIMLYGYPRNVPIRTVLCAHTVTIRSDVFHSKS